MNLSGIRSVVVAPDSFKGSITSREAARAIGEGVLDVLPGAHVHLHPVSDGGEGLIDVLAPHLGGETITSRVCGPLPGTEVEARWIFCREKSLVVLEMAEAAGLLHLPPALRNPMVTTTRGVGELIRTALDAGAREIIVGIGGSATNDGGAGMAEGLGVRFLDASGEPLPPGGGSLRRLASIDLSGIDPRVHRTRFTIAGDVTNPLLGHRGATAVFAMQKGAKREDIPILEGGLARLADLLEELMGVDIRQRPGGGGAGGLGGGLFAFCGAVIQSGIDLVLDLTRFDESLEGADLVIAGEGRLDAQSRQGKAISGVIRRAEQRGIPVVAMAGSVEGLSSDAPGEMGLRAVGSLVDDRTSLEDAMRAPIPLLRERTAALLRSTFGS